MALNNMGLGFIFTARNLASGTINRLNGQLGNLSNRSRLTGIAMASGFGLATAGIASLIAGLGVLGGAVSLAGLAGNFEQQMSLIGELADASGERLERLRTAAIEAGLATRFSPDEAVEGLRNLITAGLQAEQAAEALTPALQVAEFGMISVADAGAAVVGSMNAFREQGLSAQQIADRLATAMARTNFQAQDFDVGLSAVAGTAGMFNQTLDTTLVGLGLLRNMNIGASRSATALREAIRRLGSDARAQESAIALIGREGLFEGGTGGMRNILEIMEDLRVATLEQTEADRNATIARMLGTRGIQTFRAVVGAEFRRTLADGTTEILRGIEAARELERQMTSSAGMAQRLQQAVSEGNYAGIVNVMKGVAQTLLIEMGRPIAEVLIPVVMALRDVLAATTRFINRVPLPIKKFVAAMILLSGVLLTGGGLVAILTGAVIMLLPFLKITALVLAGLAASFSIVTGPIMAVIGAIALLREAFILNIGGIATFFENIRNRITLTYDAIRQLFTQGYFSGDVRDEMRRAENQGIQRFAVNLFRIWARIREFFRGMKIGFSRFAQNVKPAFETLKNALRELGQAFGFVTEGVDSIAGSDMNTWAETGARVGDIFARVLEKVVRGITWMANVWIDTVKFFRIIWSEVEPIFTTLGESLLSLGKEFMALFNEIGILFGKSQGDIISWGEIIRFIFTHVIGFTGFLVLTIVSVIRAFVWLVNTAFRVSNLVGDFFFRMGIRIHGIFVNIVSSIRNAIDTVISMLGLAVQRIPASFRTTGMDDMIRAGGEARERIANRNRAIPSREVITQAQLTVASARQERAYEISPGSESRDRQLKGIMEAIQRERALDRQEATRPINISIDGEVIASAVGRADRRAGARAFAPVAANSD